MIFPVLIRIFKGNSPPAINENFAVIAKEAVSVLSKLWSAFQSSGRLISISSYSLPAIPGKRHTPFNIFWSFNNAVNYVWIKSSFFHTVLFFPQIADCIKFFSKESARCFIIRRVNTVSGDIFIISGIIFPKGLFHLIVTVIVKFRCAYHQQNCLCSGLLLPASPCQTYRVYQILHLSLPARVLFYRSW